MRGAVVEPPKTPRSGIPKGRPTTTGTRGPWDSFDHGYRRRQRIARVIGAAAARRGSGEHGNTPTQTLILYQTARTRSEHDHLHAQTTCHRFKHKHPSATTHHLRDGPAEMTRIGIPSGEEGRGRATNHNCVDAEANAYTMDIFVRDATHPIQMAGR